MFTKCLLLLSTATLLAAHQGPQFEGRIIGGKNESIENAPWQISLQNNGEHFCGGSIYNEKIIVTAAHCLKSRNATELKVRLGSNNKREGGSLLDVAEAKLHEKYSAVTDEYDVALILLKTPINLNGNNKVKAIELAEETPTPGAHATVTGWGKMGTKIINHVPVSIFPDILQTVDVDIVDHEECQKLYKNKITTDMICAALPGKDSCNRDSGGPLVSNGKLVGIVSFGIGCAKPDYPGVYANVALAKKWIKEGAKELQSRPKY